MPGLSVRRLALVFIGAALVVASLGFGLLGSVESMVSYRYAEDRPACAAHSAGGAQPDCLEQQTGTVAKAWMQTIDNGAGPEDRFYVSVVGASGAPTRTITVDEAVYDTASAGDRVRLRLWRGQVVGLEVDGVDYDPAPRPPLSQVAWTMLAWDGLGLALWAASRRRTSGNDRGEALMRVVIWTAQGAILGMVTAFGLIAHGWWEYALAAAGFVCVLVFSRVSTRDRP